MPDPDLSGQVALVTGASRGIGKAISLALGRHGAEVLLVARRMQPLADVAEAITAAGGRARCLPGDIASEDHVRRIFETVGTGSAPLDILVNNAGIGRYAPVEEIEATAIDTVFGVNVRGTMLCCREALRLMQPRDRGTIINISSVVGFKGYPGQSVYTASKHAVMGFTKSLAAECGGCGIRVSAILPGGVDTDMVAEARPDLDRDALLHPDDVAQAVLYLLALSDRAAVDQIYLRRRSGTAW